MAKTTGAHLLRQHLGPYEKKLQAKDVSQLLRDFEDWQKAPESLSVKETAWSTSSQERALPRDLLAFLRSELERIRVRLRDLARMQAELTSRCARAVTEEERQEQILLFARELGATSGQLRGDRKAFNRWFDLDAVTDRYQRQKTALDRRVTLCLRYLGRIAAQLLSSLSVPSEIQRFWTWLATERLVAPLFLAEETPRVAVAAFQALSTALSAVPVELAETLVSEELLRFIYRASLDSRQNVWIQCEALSLLRHISPDSAMKALSIRAQQPGEGDELFVRRRVVLLLESMLTSRPGARKLLEQAASDPAPFVRQQVAAILVADSEADLSIIRRLLLEDSAEQIRAAGLLALLTCLDQPKPNLKHLSILVESLRTDQSPLVLRTALKVASEGAQALAPDSHADLRIQSFQRWTGELLSVIEWLHRESPHLSVRRWAAQARERIWCEMEPEARKLKRALKETVSSLAPGKSRRLRSGRLPTTDRDLIGRVLAVLALEDFGFGVEQHWWGWKVTRDPCFGFRTWRFLHELRHPDAAKRQGFSHMAGRVSHAEIRAFCGAG